MKINKENHQMKLTKSIVNKKRAYTDRVSIENMNTDLKRLLEIKNKTYKSIIKDTETIMDMDPIYQRDFVWTLEQKQSYIKNLFNGIATITPTIIEYYKNDYKTHVLEILDGKQRLNAIFEFIENKFPIVIDSNEIYYNDLIESDKKFILRHDVIETRIMPRDLSKEVDLKDKIQIFLEINELGTKMNDEHLKKVKELI